MLILLIVLLALAVLGLGFWAWSQARSLRSAARQLREREGSGSAARLRLAVPNRAAEDLLEEVDRLRSAHQADRTRWREQEQSIRRQIANISHDLRTPLTSILGYLQLLEDPDLPEGERREYLAVVESRAKALQSLITGFYDLSRLEGGEYPLEREPVDLHAALSGLLAAFYNDFTDAGFEVAVDLAEGLPPVWGDRGAVLRVFTNLLRNALDHGNGELTVRLFREGDRVVSLFANQTGQLTAEDLPHVFDRFFTSDKMRTGRNTGLGLAIVKALADRMGCQIQAALTGDVFTLRVAWEPAQRQIN